MTAIVIVTIDPARSEELAETCSDITQYVDFVQKRTGLSGAELFDATKAYYSKIGWAPWDLLTWKPATS